MLALACDNRDAVDAMIEAAKQDGTIDINAVQDLGFMYGRSFTDPDGYIWEPFWMDAVAVPAE